MLTCTCYVLYSFCVCMCLHTYTWLNIIYKIIYCFFISALFMIPSNYNHIQVWALVSQNSNFFLSFFIESRYFFIVYILIVVSPPKTPLIYSYLLSYKNKTKQNKIHAFELIKTPHTYNNNKIRKKMKHNMIKQTNKQKKKPKKEKGIRNT